MLQFSIPQVKCHQCGLRVFYSATVLLSSLLPRQKKMVFCDRCDISLEQSSRKQEWNVLHMMQCTQKVKFCELLISKAERTVTNSDTDKLY